MLNKKQLKILEPYRSKLVRSLSNYITGLYSKDVEILESVYNQLGYKLNSRTCPSCILTMCKKLGMEIIDYEQSKRK